MKRDKKSKLKNATVELLKKRPADITYADIERETGLKEAWIKSLVCGSVNDPSASRLETLYEFLSKKSLQV